VLVKLDFFLPILLFFSFSISIYFNETNNKFEDILNEELKGEIAQAILFQFCTQLRNK